MRIWLVVFCLLCSCQVGKEESYPETLALGQGYYGEEFYLPITECTKGSVVSTDLVEGDGAPCYFVEVDEEEARYIGLPPEVGAAVSFKMGEKPVVVYSPERLRGYDSLFKARLLAHEAKHIAQHMAQEQEGGSGWDREYKAWRLQVGLFLLTLNDYHTSEDKILSGYCPRGVAKVECELAKFAIKGNEPAFYQAIVTLYPNP